MLKAILETQAKVIFIINLMSLSDVEISDVKQVGEFCRFSVTGKYVDAAKHVLECHGKEYRVVKDGTLRGFIKKNALRLGLYAGISFVVFFFIAWNGVVTRTEISGTNRIEQEVIISAITEYMPLPARKKKIDLDELELKLIGINGVSNVSLEIKGDVLFVGILEELVPPELIDFNDRTPIFSQYDAVVTKVLTYSGTPRVTVGDTVRKGDELISPIKTNADGSISETKPLGDVYGRVWISKECICTSTVIRRVRTGQEKSYFTTTTYMGTHKSPYKLFDVAETTCYIGSLKLRKVTFYEVIEEEQNLDYERERENIINEKTLELEKDIPQGAEKVKTWFTEKTVDKNTILDIYYEIIVKISD